VDGAVIVLDRPWPVMSVHDDVSVVELDRLQTALCDVLGEG
jgi:hypothetical protein